jgi:catechol 2,3-dioxygenase-like lactoylglutathione lyase family enzyme
VAALNLATVEIKAFVPARDFERSKEFYQALGFRMPFASSDLAYFHAGNCAFMLQNFYVEQLANNLMMHLLVENADHWYQHVCACTLAGRFGVRLGAPEDRPWAMRDFTLTDPSGVLWRIGHNIARTEATP